MPLPFYRFLHGELIVQGKQPDGDSVRFVPYLARAFADLRYARRVRPNVEDGSVQLRLEGIDAPEVHYGPYAQPYGAASRTAFLAMLGFGDVSYEADGNRVANARPARVPATVLTHAADANGRIVSYVLPHLPEVSDGTEARMDEALLGTSYNHAMVREGHAYVMAYTSTPAAHQALFRDAALSARLEGRGLWTQDFTAEWHLGEQADIGPAGQLIFPKLFRRCSDYMASVRGGFRGNLTDWLVESRAGRGRDEDDHVVVGGQVETRLSTLLHQRNSRIAMMVDPLELTFVEH